MALELLQVGVSVSVDIHLGIGSIGIGLEADLPEVRDTVHIYVAVLRDRDIGLLYRDREGCPHFVVEVVGSHDRDRMLPLGQRQVYHFPLSH